MEGSGTHTIDGNIWTLRFERLLHHPVEKVWEHLTTGEKLKGWLSENGTIDLRAGGEVLLQDEQIAGTILALEPPRVIEYGWKGAGGSWDGGTVRWELEPAGGGTRLVLTHRMKAMSPAETEEFKGKFPDLPPGWHPQASTLAGWHYILDRLGALLDGAPFPWDRQAWSTRNGHYTRELGVSTD